MSSLTQFTSKLAKLKTVNFTSSGTFTVPSGVSTINVTMIAGGGGYSRIGYHNGIYGYVGGGGGGYYINEPVNVTPGDVLTITVGSGGTSAYFYLNFNGTATMWYGTATIGGSSSVYSGATKLLQTYGGTPGSDNSNQYGALTNVGQGGWPNGAGGGGAGAAAGGRSGYGNVNSNGYNQAYSRAPYANSAANAGTVGMGEFPGANSYSGGSPIPGNYGVGADTTGSYSTTARTPGANGFVQISYFEV